MKESRYRNWLFAIVSALSVLLIPLSAPADDGKLDSIGAFDDSNASAELKKALEPQGYRVTLSDGGVLCEIWLRATITTGKNEAQGTGYPWLTESTLVAVIKFPKDAIDYRKQGIKAGSYTLRAALNPVDGNHLGISSLRDFLLLSPVSVDTDPNVKYLFEDLTALSKKTTGSNHPSPLSLVSLEGITTWPSVFQDENRHLVFAAKVKTGDKSEAPIAWVVRGVAEQ
ncbi:MAG TPA: hypothetical protein VN643_21120 [Pyrinomonadaceae bacterium]|nr:hypothetical protein [Pyrinomonadaceae bacterium]